MAGSIPAPSAGAFPAGATAARRSAQPDPVRGGPLPVALVAAGAALAVLAGRDGSPGWQGVRAGTAVVLTWLALAALSRATDRGRGRGAAALGVVVVAVGAGFAPYLTKETRSLEGVAAAATLLAGIVLAVAGTTLATRDRRLVRRIAAAACVLVATLVGAFVVGVPVAATNVPRPAIGASPADAGLPAETVRLTTEDGIELAGWYVASENRAAVVLLHGAGSTRSNVLDHALVLARHGFGVLLVDARGHGESGGRAMDLGWYGDADVAAATAFLADRPDVDPERIGVVGMSMGGEEAIGASGSNNRIRAVVAEGATARVASDEDWLSEAFGLRGLLQEQLEELQDAVTGILTGAPEPASLRAAVESSAGTAYLLVSGGTEPDERRAAAHIASGAPDRVTTWAVEGAGHTDGLRVAPQEWERRVVDFLEQALDLPAGGRGPAG